MSDRRFIRQQTLQLLCQFDAGNEDSPSITDLTFNEDTSSTNEPDPKAASIAKNIWEYKEQSDKAIGELTPDWPIHRQPLIDRNILRLGFYEITSDQTPPIAAINEAIELAKEFGTEDSPSFVNAVLEKIMVQHNENSNNNTETSST